jgi:anti-sigma regulatory factor (Ser/Thr protein kinase)
MSPDRSRLAVSTTAQPASVRQLRVSAVGFAASHGATDAVQHAVALAVSEAATNAVVHAYRPPAIGTGTIELTGSIDPLGRLCLTVADDGIGMSPRPDSPGLGVGLPTIAQLADDVQILTGTGTALIMYFDLTADDPKPA